MRVLVTPGCSLQSLLRARERTAIDFLFHSAVEASEQFKNSCKMAKKKTGLKVKVKKPPSLLEVESEICEKTEKKRFSCPCCDQAFSRKYDMEKHQRKHTGEKPYKCGICGKQFVQVGSLAVHMRSHTGEMPYTCDVCGKGFAVKERLRLHQRTHTGNYRFLFKWIKITKNIQSTSICNHHQES